MAAKDKFVAVVRAQAPTLLTTLSARARPTSLTRRTAVQANAGIRGHIQSFYWWASDIRRLLQILFLEQYNRRVQALKMRGGR